MTLLNQPYCTRIVAIFADIKWAPPHQLITATRQILYTGRMSQLKPPSTVAEFPLSLIKNMVGLATSGFGVVVALAWNSLIQETVTRFITPYLGQNSGLMAMAIYTIVITVLAVLVTMQLTSLERKFELINQKAAERRAKKKTT